MKDWYAILGVSESATREEIKRAWRQHARENHEDLHGQDPAKAEKIRDANAAWEVLGDSLKRSQYDVQRRVAAEAAQREASRRAAAAAQRQREAASARDAATTWDFSPRREQPAASQGASFAHARPSPRSTAPARTTSTGDGGGWLAALLTIGAAFGAALAIGAANSGTYYDSSVDRNRGPDGRFRRS